jgi:hypothetical protein
MIKHNYMFSQVLKFFFISHPTNNIKEVQTPWENYEKKWKRI